MIFRFAASADLGAVRRLWLQGEDAFAEAPSFFRGRTFDDTRDAVFAGNILLAVEGEEVIGMLGLGLHGCPHGFIFNVFIDREMRRSGVGRELIAEAHRLLKERGMDDSHVLIWSENGLHQFYEKQGYRQVGVFLRKDL